MDFPLRKCLVVACGLMVLCVCGCKSPEKRFKQTGAQVYREGEELGGVVFGALIDTGFLRGQQFMFKVRLMDERARAIKSNNRAYEDSSGNVAAQKTLMVLDGQRGPQRVEVRIPKQELELRTNDFPVWISYGLYEPDGTTFAVVYRPMPRNTQAIVKQFVQAQYGNEPSATAPPAQSSRRRTRRPVRSRSPRWRPDSERQGPGFCPRHGIACACPLRQDVPPEYMGSQTRRGSRAGRSTIGPSRAQKARRPARSP
ncbi:MAG: hypothetical protein GXP29_03305 [Planctomycetes bacterium]|nr:hypothetical protein [Planctomycetota bacterium]